VKGYLAPRYAELIGKEIQTAYLESYAEYGQNIFDRYVTFADCWIQEEDYRDPRPARASTAAALNSELEKVEKPAGIANPKDFRNEIVNFVLRRGRTTTAAIPCGAATRSCARSSRRRCSRTPRTCCP
jgi:serine protein kinase